MSPGLSLEPIPQLVGAMEERNIGGILEIGLPDDAGPAVARAPVVRGTKLFDAQYRATSCGDLIRRRAPHRAEAHDDHIEPGHQPPPTDMREARGQAAFVRPSRTSWKAEYRVPMERHSERKIPGWARRPFTSS